MDASVIKSRLHLYAVLPNLAELIRHDPESARMAQTWDICIQFSVRKGPAAHIVFDNGSCRVERGAHARPDVKLFFTSPDHLNRMMAGKANPIPLKGFTRLGFLTRRFPKLTERLETLLKPPGDLLADADVLALNTRLTLHTAAHAAQELARYDPIGRLIAPTIPDGDITLMVMPDGPAVTLHCRQGTLTPRLSASDAPDALIQMDGMDTAHRFLNGGLDTFAAIATGRIRIRGRIPMIDALGTILDRIPHYLS